jgi:hypothetical protein
MNQGVEGHGAAAPWSFTAECWQTASGAQDHRGEATTLGVAEATRTSSGKAKRTTRCISRAATAKRKVATPARAREATAEAAKAEDTSIARTNGAAA